MNSIKNLFSRCKCDSNTLRDLVSNWTENEGWESNDFLTFLQLIGVNAPIKLRDIDSDKKSFKCISNDGKTFTLTLYFRDEWDFCSEIYITEGNETKGYTCFRKSEYRPTPQLEYKCRKFSKTAKKLYSYY